MRNKLVPQSLAELVALCAGRIPVPVLDSLFPLLKARSLMAGERLGVFEALEGGPQPVAALARGLGLDEESLQLLLRVLVGSGYLTERVGRYRLSPLGRRTLVRGGSLECRGFLRFNYTHWRLVEHLEQLLQTGQGLDLHRTMQDRHEWENYQRAMLDLARPHGPFLARRVPVARGARLLIDVAGSHGSLGAAICRRHPPLRSRVLELPLALESARRLAEEEGITDLVDHIAADIRTDSLGDGADVILLANVAHHLSPEENRNLLSRAREALSPGGTMAIWDFEHPAASTRADMGRDAISLFFRMTSASRCYSEAELRSWLQAAGFGKVQAVRTPLAPLHLLVHARG